MKASQEGAGPPGGRANSAAAVLGPHTKGARPAVTRGRARRGRPLRRARGEWGCVGACPAPRPARAPRDAHGWLHAATAATGNTRPPWGGVFCVVLWDISREPRGARWGGGGGSRGVRGCRSRTRRLTQVPACPLQRALWAPGLAHAARAAPGARRAPEPTGRPPAACRRSGNPRFAGLGRAPVTVQAALGLVFPRSTVSAEREVVQAGAGLGPADLGAVRRPALDSALRWVSHPLEPWNHPACGAQERI